MPLFHEILTFVRQHLNVVMELFNLNHATVRTFSETPYISTVQLSLRRRHILDPKNFRSRKDVIMRRLRLLRAQMRKGHSTI